MNADSGVDSFMPYQGTYAAYLGTVGAVSALTQTLKTVAGTRYTLQFALMNDTDPDGAQNSFTVLFGGNALFSETNTPADLYTIYTLTGTATGANTDLSFLSRNDVGTFDLDNVSVVAGGGSLPSVGATPEPSSFALLGTGLLSLTGLVRRRLQTAA